MFSPYVSGHFHIYTDEKRNMRCQVPYRVMTRKHFYVSGCFLYTDRNLYWLQENAASITELPEERSSQLLHSRTLKSHIASIVL